MADGNFTWEGFNYDKMAQAAKDKGLFQASPGSSKVDPGKLKPEDPGQKGLSESHKKEQAYEDDRLKKAEQTKNLETQINKIKSEGNKDDENSKKSHKDYLTTAAAFLDANAEFSWDTLKNTRTLLTDLERSGVTEAYRQAQFSFGLRTDQMKKGAVIQNELTKQELERTKLMQDRFFTSKNRMIDYYKNDGEYLQDNWEMQKDINNKNHRMLKSFTAEEREEALLFKKGMKEASKHTVDLLNRTYAYSGETSSKILTDITSHAQAMSDATGMSFQDLADDTAQIMADTERFGNMSVDTAARIASSYKQLGLDLQTFGKIIDSYRSFDSAAQKMGDLSAMFGVQMDAMEMMYLANEDEEEFLHRMRDQMLDQGVDVENMSKTRLRALGDQMGMSQTQLQTFFREGELVKDRAAQEEASAKASKETSEETLENIRQQMRVLPKTEEAWKALAKSKDWLQYREDVADLAPNIDKMTTSINNVMKDIKFPKNPFIEKLLGVEKPGKEDEAMGAKQVTEKWLSEEYGKKISKTVNDELLQAVEGYDFSESTDALVRKIGDNPIEKTQGKWKEVTKRKSMPKLWKDAGLQDALDWFISPEGLKESSKISQGLSFGMTGNLEKDVKESAKKVKEGLLTLSSEGTPGKIDVTGTVGGKSRTIEQWKELMKNKDFAKYNASKDTDKTEELKKTLSDYSNINIEEKARTAEDWKKLYSSSDNVKTSIDSMAELIKSGHSPTVVVNLDKKEFARLMMETQLIDGRTINVNVPE